LRGNDGVGRGWIGEYAARAGGADVEPDGGGAGAAVEDEGEGAVNVGGEFFVGDVEELADRFAVVVELRELAGGGAIGEGLAIDQDGVLGGLCAVGGFGRGTR